jgi:hypothetical protein
MYEARLYPPQNTPSTSHIWEERQHTKICLHSCSGATSREEWVVQRWTLQRPLHMVPFAYSFFWKAKHDERSSGVGSFLKGCSDTIILTTLAIWVALGTPDHSTIGTCCAYLARRGGSNEPFQPSLSNKKKLTRMTLFSSCIRWALICFCGTKVFMSKGMELWSLPLVPCAIKSTSGFIAFWLGP